MCVFYHFSGREVFRGAQQYKILIDGYHVRDVTIVEQYDRAFSLIQKHLALLAMVVFLVFFAHDSSHFLPDKIIDLVNNLTSKHKLLIFLAVISFCALFTTPYHLTM